ncbi:hypothetical protein [Salinisphaera sp. Q1T1-3]|uniref:hypothetical protein n=1 Tax=Salinisphaera sp. Q1T1-3 TaxID=2321229 RepID=UPI0011C3EEDB|nr:hypothetical protein [Salinisphaera sp. Q1T1-3]
MKHRRHIEGVVLKLLSLFNWSILTLAVLATLLGSVLCLLMWPFPQMAGDGQRFDDVVTATELGLVVALIAAGTTWLFDQRRAAMWAAEATLVLAVIASIIYGLFLR